jgi:hypothetical protein
MSAHRDFPGELKAYFTVVQTSGLIGFDFNQTSWQICISDYEAI